MQLIRTISALRRWVRQTPPGTGPRALVPTMGYLHAGHLRLIHEARRRVGLKGQVVVSIYVNPTQFAPTEDLARYPRDLPRDVRMCRAAGVDVVFAPTDAEMYPGRAEGRFTTYVVEEQLSRVMEGASRPTHFRGVTTVVARLFNLVQPDVAVFGAKDWQQAVIIRRMVANLNFPLRVVVVPTAREPDGLALSSRNQYLNAAERQQATILFRALQWARARVRHRAVPAARLKAGVKRLVASAPLARLDYVEVFDPDTLQPVPRARRGAHLALAVFLGKTRLIDNGRL